MTPIMMAALLLGLNLDPVPLCLESSAAEVCCSAGCAAKRSPTTTFKADAIFRACVKAFGCEHVDNWTVFMRCQCPRGKP